MTIVASSSDVSTKLDLALRDPGDIEQVIDEAAKVLDLSIDDPHRTTSTASASVRARWRERTALLMAAQRVPQLVGKHRQEFVLAPVGVLEFGRSLLKGIFEPPPVGHIAKDLEISACLPGVVLEWHDQSVRPEPLSVFPDVPAFVKGLAFVRSLPHHDLEPSGLTVLGREGELEILAEDFGLGIAEGLLRPQVPGGDHPFKVEGENGIARGALDDMAIPFATIPQFGPGSPPFRDVFDGEEDEPGLAAPALDLAAIEEHPAVADEVERLVHLEVLE